MKLVFSLWVSRGWLYMHILCKYFKNNRAATNFKSFRFSPSALLSCIWFGVCHLQLQNASFWSSETSFLYTGLLPIIGLQKITDCIFEFSMRTSGIWTQNLSIWIWLLYHWANLPLLKWSIILYLVMLEISLRANFCIKRKQIKIHIHSPKKLNLCQNDQTLG